MDRKPVEGSSNIVSYGYEGDVLEVEFCRGSVYQYSGVTPTMFADFCIAESKGRYLNAVIKPACPCVKMEPVPA